MSQKPLETPQSRQVPAGDDLPDEPMEIVFAEDVKLRQDSHAASEEPAPKESPEAKPAAAGDEQKQG